MVAEVAWSTSLLKMMTRLTARLADSLYFLATKARWSINFPKWILLASCQNHQSALTTSIRSLKACLTSEIYKSFTRSGHPTLSRPLAALADERWEWLLIIHFDSVGVLTHRLPKKLHASYACVMPSEFRLSFWWTFLVTCPVSDKSGMEWYVAAQNFSMHSPKQSFLASR